MVDNVEYCLDKTLQFSKGNVTIDAQILEKLVAKNILKELFIKDELDFIFSYIGIWIIKLEFIRTMKILTLTSLLASSQAIKFDKMEDTQ